jgi:hypothetical protein
MPAASKQQKHMGFGASEREPRSIKLARDYGPLGVFRLAATHLQGLAVFQVVLEYALRHGIR